MNKIRYYPLFWLDQNVLFGNYLSQNLKKYLNTTYLCISDLKKLNFIEHRSPHIFLKYAFDAVDFVAEFSCGIF